jgi:hypothetical protein
LETHISSSWCEISERVYEIMEIEDCARDWSEEELMQECCWNWRSVEYPEDLLEFWLEEIRVWISRISSDIVLLQRWNPRSRSDEWWLLEDPRETKEGLSLAPKPGLAYLIDTVWFILLIGTAVKMGRAIGPAQ